MADYIDRQAVIRFIRDKVSLSLFMKRSVDKADKACMELCDMLNRDLPSADVEPIVRCKDCHFFEQDHWETVNGVPLIVAHNICTRWGVGCQTEEDGFCFMAIRSQGARMDGDANAE